MRDDEIDDAQKPSDHPVTAMLERLDSDDEDFDAGADDPIPTIGRREVDALVDMIVEEELKRLNGRKG
jgi:hypothetical protein